MVRRFGVVGVAVALIVLGAAVNPSLATKGNRKGCLAIFNNSGQDLVVYTSGPDGSWRLKSGTRSILSGDPGQPLTVDEETVVWATTVDGNGSYRRYSLLADPSTEYDAGTRDDCVNHAVWLKIFI